jgi:membrane protease subunit HflC
MVQTQTLLEQKLNDGIRAEFGKRTIQEIVSGGRTEIMKLLLEYAKKNVDELGVSIRDVRIKRIDLPLEVSTAVFERMKAERKRVATQHRAQGESQAAFIRASADKDVTVIKAEAESKSKTIRGEADALAAQIYSNAYSKDPEFFAFYRSISAYRTIFEKSNDVIVLKPNSHFFRYFKGIGDSK